MKVCLFYHKIIPFSILIKYPFLIEYVEIFNPNHPLRCIICRLSNVGKSVFLTNLYLNVINEYDTIYIYSPSLCQDLYQRLIKCFSKFIPYHIIPIILNEEDIDIVTDEIVNNNDCEKSDTEIKTYESIEELKFRQEYDDGAIIILENLNEQERNDPRVQEISKRSRYNNLSMFIISQDYYELPIRTIRANGNTYHIFKSNIVRGVQNLYQDKASIDMTRNDFKYLTSTCGKEKYQPLTIDMTKDRYKVDID